ncbi:MAG: quinon protein alcohol dehydrogenase-like superfamily [Monoraphidium minutum]|nr:MAG: quinon protein alcohol dehydrogenase-like superfamily [Monoraphidium minutum]
MPPLQASNWMPELKRTWSQACNGGVRAILLSQRGKVAVATPDCVHLYDGPPGFAPRHELRAEPPGVTVAAFGAKGADVVAGGADGFVRWWQADSGEELCSTQFPAAGEQQQQEEAGGGDAPSLAVSEITVSKAGQVAAARGSVLSVFGPGGEQLLTLDAGEGPALRHVTWLGNDTLLAARGTEALAWRVGGGAAEGAGSFATNPAAAIAQLALSPDGRHLAAACDNRTVQVWDTQQEAPDPALVITEGIDSAAGCLSWDAGSRLLSAAVGSEALVWDVSSVEEGRVESSYVCIGFEVGAAVTRVAFQPNGTLLAVAADNGLCLVFDSAAFGAGGSASNLASHAASGRVAPAGGEDGGGGGGAAGAVEALVWHSTGSLLIGTSTGVVGALQPLRAGLQRTASEAQGDAALRRQESASKRRAAAQPPGAAADGAAPAPAPKAAAAAAAGGGAPAGARQAPAGWGGEPLASNGVSGASSGEYEEAAAAAGGGRYGGAMQQPYPQQPYAKRDGGGGIPGPAPPPGGPPKAMGGGGGPAMGAMAPEQQAQMMQAAVAAQWGMMPAAMPQMWARQMGMGYAMPPYGQVWPRRFPPRAWGFAARARVSHAPLPPAKRPRRRGPARSAALAPPCNPSPRAPSARADYGDPPGHAGHGPVGDGRLPHRHPAARAGRRPPGRARHALRPAPQHGRPHGRRRRPRRRRGAVWRHAGRRRPRRRGRQRRLWAARQRQRRRRRARRRRDGVPAGRAAAGAGGRLLQ